MKAKAMNPIVVYRIPKKNFFNPEEEEDEEEKEAEKNV